MNLDDAIEISRSMLQKVKTAQGDSIAKDTKEQMQDLYKMCVCALKYEKGEMTKETALDSILDLCIDMDYAISALSETSGDYYNTCIHALTKMKQCFSTQKSDDVIGHLCRLKENFKKMDNEYFPNYHQFNKEINTINDAIYALENEKRDFEEIDEEFDPPMNGIADGANPINPREIIHNTMRPLWILNIKTNRGSWKVFHDFNSRKFIFTDDASLNLDDYGNTWFAYKQEQPSINN